MPVKLRSFPTNKPPDPYALIQTLKDLVAAVNANETQGQQLITHVTALTAQANRTATSSGSGGGGGGIPAPIGPFPPLVVATDAALGGDGTAVQPLAVQADNSTVVINASNQLTAPPGGATGVLPVANGGTGTSVAFTPGSAIFAGVAGVYNQDNANFFWDDTNNRLGIGNAAPVAPLHVTGAARVGSISSPAQISATVGTQNAFAVTSTVVRLTNATDTTINGIAAGVDGQEVTFYSDGAGDAYFNHASGSAAAGDKLSLFVTVGSTAVAAGFGSITFRYNATLLVWRVVSHDQGNFISIPFGSCVYDSNTGAFWTVLLAQVISQKFFIVGHTIFLHVTINSSTTLLGVGARLRIDFSAFQPWSWLNTTRNWARVVDAAAAQNGMVTCAAATSLIQFSHDAADTAWAVGAGRTLDGVTVFGMLT